jgi:mannose-6-phosphate isomerase-like protein (cupin superfamily)
MDDARFRIELRRYWDEIARGEPATPDDLDPDLAALIRRLHALPDVPPPDPTFARQLRESLMHATTTPLPLTDPRTSLRRNGQSAPPVRRPILSGFPVSPVRWAPAYLVTALLVMLVLIGSVLVIGPGRPVSQDHIPLFLAAISGTPATLETVATETLFDVPVDDLPTGTGTAGVVRWTLEPGPQPLLFPAQTGPRFLVVESGEVTATEAGVEHRLGPGDVYFAADPEEVVAIHVSGPETVSLLWGYVPNAEREATRDLEAHDYDWLIDGTYFALPGGSGRLVFEQLTLPPGSALPPLEARSLDWFEVGEGTLGVTLEGDDLPVGWPVGEERMFRVGTTTTVPIPPGTRMTLRNAGEDPLILYRLTLTPDAAAAAAGTPVP